MAIHKMQKPTVAEIYHQIQKNANAADWRRDHLGCSQLGKKCERELWYSWRWYARPQFDGRIFRLFRRGKNEEIDLGEDLRAAGVTVLEGPEPGKQFRASILWGHVGGSIDFALLGLKEAPNIWHVGECKTYSLKGFEAVERRGLFKARPVYYAQIQLYCELFGFTYGAHLGVCKDDDRINLERFRADSYFAGELIEKAARILKSSAPPPKMFKADSSECKFCQFRDVCHVGARPVKSCRSCQNGKPQLEGAGGAWRCSKWDRLITPQEQRAACEQYTKIGALPVLGE